MTEGASREAFRQAVRILARRALTRGELVERLKRKGYAAHAEEAAARAVSKGFVDEAGIAARLAERFLVERAYGRRRAVREMRRRLLPEATIRRVLDEMDTGRPDLEEDALRRSLAAWIARHGPPADDGARMRLAAHLGRRGFREAQVRRAVLDPPEGP